MKPQGKQGHVQHGARFVIMIQADSLLKLSTAIVAPTSRNAQPASFRPRVRIQREETHVLIDQITAIDRNRIGKHVGALTVEEMWAVDDAIRTTLAV